MAVIGIVLAKGWTLVRRKLSARSRAAYGLLLVLYFFTGWWGIFWSTTFYTKYDAVEFFQSLPAALLLVLRSVLTIGFLWYRPTPLHLHHIPFRAYSYSLNAISRVKPIMRT